MYPVELEIKDTTESNTSASYLDLLLSIGKDGQLHTSIFDKRDDFNFHITNFLFLSSNIPTSSAYCVCILQLIRYARACSSYGCFILRATRLSNKLLEQGYVRNAWNRHWGSFMVDTGILSNNMKFPSHKYLMTFCDLTIYNDNTPTDQTLLSTDLLSFEHPSVLLFCFVPNSTLVLSRFYFYRILSGFHRTFATGVAFRQGTLTPLDTWSRPFGTCIYSTCWDQSFFRTCRYFSGLCSSDIPWYFLDFALDHLSVNATKNIRPRLNQSEAVDVYVQLWLTRVMDCTFHLEDLLLHWRISFNK